MVGVGRRGEGRWRKATSEDNREGAAAGPEGWEKGRSGRGRKGSERGRKETAKEGEGQAGRCGHGGPACGMAGTAVQHVRLMCGGAVHTSMRMRSCRWKRDRIRCATCRTENSQRDNQVSSQATSLRAGGSIRLFRAGGSI